MYSESELFGYRLFIFRNPCLEFIPPAESVPCHFIEVWSFTLRGPGYEESELIHKVKLSPALAPDMMLHVGVIILLGSTYTEF